MITRDEIRETLMKLFEAETGEPLDSLTDDQNMAEHLGLDSVDMVSLIMQLERHFKIRLTHEELAAFVGSTRVTVTNALGELRDLGLIEGTRGLYEIQEVQLENFIEAQNAM